LNPVKIVSKLILKNGTIIFLNHNSIFFKICMVPKINMSCPRALVSATQAPSMTYKNPHCCSAVHCDYNVSILQEYVKTQHPGNLAYYNRFSQLGKPSVYHTARRPRIQFYDVIFSLVIIRSLNCNHSSIMTSLPIT